VNGGQTIVTTVWWGQLFSIRKNKDLKLKKLTED